MRQEYKRICSLIHYIHFKILTGWVDHTHKLMGRKPPSKQLKIHQKRHSLSSSLMNNILCSYFIHT